jgi:hypothetical protein
MLAERVLEIVHRTRTASGGPLRVMSGQMGLVSYRLARAEFGEVRFLDRYALTTAHFTSCPITASIERGVLGMQLSYERYFAHRLHLERSCGIAGPDLIFDLDNPGWPVATVVASNGYRIVYRQGGVVAHESRWFPGEAVGGEAFVAVRADLPDTGGYPPLLFPLPPGAATESSEAAR